MMFLINSEVETGVGPGTVWGYTPEGFAVVRLREPVKGYMFNGWQGHFPVSELKQADSNGPKRKGVVRAQGSL